MTYLFLSAATSRSQTLAIRCLVSVRSGRGGYDALGSVRESAVDVGARCWGLGLFKRLLEE